MQWTVRDSWLFLRGMGRQIALGGLFAVWGYSPFDLWREWLVASVVLALIDTMVDRLFSAGPNGDLR